MLELEDAKKKIAENKYAEALVLLKIAEEKYPNNMDISFHFGKSYFYIGEYGFAETYFDQTLKSQDTNVVNYSKYYLAKIYMNNNEDIKALDLLLSVKKSGINIENELTKLFYSLVMLMQQNNYDGIYNKTIEMYEKYNGYIPENDIFLDNKILNEYELASKKVILSSKPRSLLVKLSNFCNLRCIMCPQEKNDIKHINKKIISLIIENLQYTEKIIWQGGEPLIIPYFKDLLVNTSRYQHIHQIVITNFQEVNDEILDLLVKNNVHLIISIDGAIKETYERIRKGGSFDKLIKNIEKINNLTGKIFLQINFVVMRENYSEMIDMVEFAHKYKFKMITFIKQDIILSEIEQRSLKKEEINYIKKNMPTIYEKAKEYGIIIENQLNLISEDNNLNQNITKRNAIIDDNKKLYCHLPWYDLTISYENVISANCLCILNNEINFEEISSMDNLWNSEALVNSRESIVNFNKKNCNDICKFLNIEYRKPLNF